MSQRRKIVITGLGVVSPIGVGKTPFWESLSAGQSGVSASPLLSESGMPICAGGHVKDFDAKLYVRPRKSLKVMCHEIQMAVAAAAMAVEDAGLTPQSADPDRCGIVFGSELFYGEIEEIRDIYRQCHTDGQFHFERWGERMGTDLFPLFMLKYLPNMAACHIGIAQDARGPNNTIALGEASSLLALIEAIRVIERGHADVMLVGGTGNRLNLTPMLYRGDSNCSHRSNDPAAASRPFDADRDGLVNGEGSAVFVLEQEEHAARRGASVFARVLGGGCGYERVDGAGPRTGAAIRTSILRALGDTQLKPIDIGHVNAHGLSTIEDDILEAQAIRDCLGDVPVTAPKSFFGSLGAGGGAVEMAVSVLGFEHGVIPPTLNYETPDPRCPVQVVHGKPAEMRDPRTALLLNQSGTGQAAAVVIAAP